MTLLNRFQGPYRGYGLQDLIPPNPFYQGVQYPTFDPQSFQQQSQQNWGMGGLNQAFQPMQFPIPGASAQQTPPQRTTKGGE